MISFTKMQALGNDFVVVDATKQPSQLSPDQVRRMGDRRFGVGFDQLLVLESSRDSDSDFYYRILNADGSEVGQCGNGARCIARFIQQRGLSNKTEYRLQTMETQLSCRVLSDGRVLVKLNPPQFEPQQIPYIPEHPPVFDQPLLVANVGNPHAVVVVDNVDSIDLPVWGKQIAQDGRFPVGVNLSVMSIPSFDRVQLRVFERGVGETRACGSAACAAMVLGKRAGLLGERVVVSQPGGDLDISWQSVDSPIEMLGSAEFIYQGKYPLL